MAPRARGRLTALAAALALTLGGGTAAGSGAVSSAEGLDQDGDGVFDSLEARVQGLPAARAVDVIVALDAPATRARVDALGERFGFTPRQRFSVVNGFSARIPAGRIAALARASEVAHVEADGGIVPFDTTAEESFGVAKARLDLPDLDGAGLVAAVVDTGVDAAHEELDGGKLIAFVDCVPTPCVAASPNDPLGHGTRVASILGGEAGVARSASLVGVKVLETYTDSGAKAQMIAGIQWVVDHRSQYGIDVLNVSVGVPVDGPVGEGCSDGTDLLSQATNAAAAAGVLVVAAAGNSGPEPCTVGAPAAATGVLTVGNMADLSAAGEIEDGEVNGFRLFWQSSRGPTLDGRVKPDILAPGVEITSAVAGTTSQHGDGTGTSVAAPFVAGVALLMLDANSALTAGDLKAILKSTAVDWGPSGKDRDYGAGRLDAYAAIRAAGARLSSPPAMPLHEHWDGALAGTGDAQTYDLAVTDTSFPVAATLIVPGGSKTAGSTNFDLELRGPGGAVVAGASQVPGASGAGGWPIFSGRQEDLGYAPPITGVYELQVRSAAGGGAYSLDVSRGPAPPLNAGSPTLSGLARDGETLSATTGTWTGTTPLAYSFQWQSSLEGKPWTAIAGATQFAYTIRSDDVGKRLRARVTATNAGGSANAYTQATTTVAPRPPIVGTAGADTLRGTGGSDVLLGKGGNDVLIGLAGDDSLFGGAGNDRLSGGEGNDRLDGGPGSDRLTGGPGRDQLAAGSGKDLLVVRDGSRDRVACGLGADVVVADRRDVVARDCESVSRA
jgi:serine protease AprX